MCGIVGIIRKNQFVSDRELQRLVNQIIHRGPDAKGFYNQENIGIGHTRLSIIDLDTGSQPMFSSNNKIIITYNGEIYNYKELKKELISKGLKFSTNSDTEVIINSYLYWGKDCLKKFRGMFAFCIVDLEKKIFFLARDFFGIKPLNYRINDEYFAFCSEIPPLVNIKGPQLKGNILAIDQFLQFQYIPDPDTIYEKVYKLEPGNFMIVSFKCDIIQKQEYWNPMFNSRTYFQKKDLEEELYKCVTTHLVSDVPFGVLLSGGIDSTIITMFMSKVLDKKISAFSIGFEESEYDETSYAETVAKKLELNLFKNRVQPKDFEVIPELILNHAGEPFGDDSILPTSILMRSARSHVPMVLSGDGGDEAFAGYVSYKNWVQNHPLNYSSKLCQEKSFLKIPRFLVGSLRKYIKNNFSTNHLDEWLNQNTIVSAEERGKLWNKDFQYLIKKESTTFNSLHSKALRLDRISYAQYLDIKTYLNSSVLRKVDISSMKFGLEVRTPFIDRYLASYFLNLEQNQKFKFINNKFEGKVALKKLVEEVFGSEFTYRRKMGFAIPKKNWFAKGEYLYNLMFDLISNNNCRLDEIFNISYIIKTLESHSNFNNHSKTLWQVLILAIWMDGNKNINF